MSFVPMTPEEIARHLHAVPLFPLPDVVFLPGSLLPLHVFEPRYRDLTTDALAGPGLIAVPRLMDGWQGAYDGKPPVHRLCGLGQIVRHQQLPDGRYNLILYGLGAFEIASEPPTDTTYRIASGHLRRDPPVDPGELTRIVGEIEALGQALVTHKPELSGAMARVREGKPGPLRYIDTVAHLVLDDADERQAWLETSGVLSRAAIVQGTLATYLAGTATIDA
ncbi:MAG: LON peptidase substrate-binding domain-containing protein [Alphaproteobacteria bacterium]|nr:LON peptidase substrate-binding domain-containing protein [Alphaproteobacteria bacterium]